MRLYRIRRTEFLLSVAAFLGVVLLGVLPGHRPGRRALDRQRLPAVVVAVPDGARSGARPPRLPRRAELPRGGAAAGLRRSSASTPRCSSPTRGPSASRSGPSPRPIRRRGGSSSPSEPITDVDTTAADMLRDLDEDAERPRHQPGLRRDEGSGQEQDRPVRADATRSTRTTSSRRSREAFEAFQEETGAEWQAADELNGETWRPSARERIAAFVALVSLAVAVAGAVVGAAANWRGIALTVVRAAASPSPPAGTPWLASASGGTSPRSSPSRRSGRWSAGFIASDMSIVRLLVRGAGCGASRSGPPASPSAGPHGRSAGWRGRGTERSDS